MIGAVGALRDNIQLLKTVSVWYSWGFRWTETPLQFAMSLFLCYIILVTGTFSLFILFYADNVEGMSAQTVLTYAVKQYSNNRNIADIVDYMQEQV